MRWIVPGACEVRATDHRSGCCPTGSSRRGRRAADSSSRSVVLSSLLVLVAAPAPALAASDASIAGVVREAGGPLAGATVRVQATPNSALSDANGRFTLGGLVPGAPVTVSAWKDGYYATKVDGVVPPATSVSVTLTRYQTNDDPSYRWLFPTGPGSCVGCHPDVVAIWTSTDAHARSATNHRFLTMYNGTDVDGNASPLTRYVYIPDYGRVPLPPDASKPYFGPGYRLDFPSTRGNCAACHTPGAAIDDPYGVDPNLVTEADRFGIHCDFCHKVAGVKVDPATGRPYRGRPGVMSMDVRRPFTGDPARPQLFFGSFDDPNAASGDSYLPLETESRFCAGCHFGVFWDVVVYDSYGEWLDSPYSLPGTGQTCQQCHMPSPTLVNGVPLRNIAPGNGGVDRDPASIHAHTFPGSLSLDLLTNAVRLDARARMEAGRVTASVTVTNDRTGHHVPTDSPLRQMILLVRAFDAAGEQLAQLSGPRIPSWGGAGDPQKGCLAGLPGKGFAKILQELWTEVAPTGAYWNQTRLLSDTRLAAFASDSSAYAFEASGERPFSVEVTLLYRRAFKALADQKKWSDPDIVMASRRFVVGRPKEPVEPVDGLQGGER